MKYAEELYRACSRFGFEYLKYLALKRSPDRTVAAACKVYEEVMRFLQYNDINTLGLGK